MDNPDTVERVAWTRLERKSGEYYLPYINARIEGDCVRVSVRGEEIEEGKCGPEATIMVPRDQFAAIAALTTPADGLGEIADELEMRVGDYRAAEAGSGRQDYLAVQLGRAVVGNIDRILTALRAAQPTERVVLPKSNELPLVVKLAGATAITSELMKSAANYEAAIDCWDAMIEALRASTDAPARRNSTPAQQAKAIAIAREMDRDEADTPATASRDAPKPPHQETDNGR